MSKVTGLNKLQKELQDAQKALTELNGKLGEVSFEPDNPSSIEAAIQTAYRMIDERVGKYSSNSIINTLIDEMKEAYRSNILSKAAEARLASKGGSK
ncbi:hypothetical protein [Vibrio diabolicus]|uniref:hypothetical protein n=1 Tax=Vibrio diabolicus TaxID=50719 RepID=UPI002494FD6A|nr:hypothetical protein [Vibrio diabolicus]